MDILNVECDWLSRSSLQGLFSGVIHLSAQSISLFDFHRTVHNMKKDWMIILKFDLSTDPLDQSRFNSEFAPWLILRQKTCKTLSDGFLIRKKIYQYMLLWLSHAILNSCWMRPSPTSDLFCRDK